jgi:hypothetical protein
LVSDDNRQQRTFDFAALQCHPQIRAELDRDVAFVEGLFSTGLGLGDTAAVRLGVGYLEAGGIRSACREHARR